MLRLRRARCRWEKLEMRNHRRQGPLCSGVRERLPSRDAARLLGGYEWDPDVQSKE